MDTQNLTKNNLVRLLFILSSLFLFVACAGDGAEEGVVITAVVEDIVASDEDVSVTRIISRTLPATPVTILDPEVEPPITLDISFIRELPPNIDPQLSTSSDGADLIENIFAGLTRFNHETNFVDPQLAREWRVEDNGRLWIFDLREDVFWIRPSTELQNGIEQAEIVRPLIANDIVYAIRRACNATNNVPDAFILFIIEGCETVHRLPTPRAADLASIGVEALDDSTLQVRLTKPSSYFLTMTSLPIFRPIPPELVEEYGEEWTIEEGFMTSGPYFPTNDALNKLVANPWWPLEKKGNVDIVNIRYLDSDEDAMTMWRDKELDYIDATNFDSAQFDDRTRSHMRTVTNQVLYYLGFNFDSGVFREEKVRRAFSAAIDRELLVEELFGDTAVGMKHIVPPGVLGSVPTDLVGVGYSPDYARLQMAESGFGTCAALPEMRFLVTTSDQSLRQAELIIKMWQDERDGLGCPEDVFTIEQAQFGTLLANTRSDAGARRPDIFELGWASYYPDAHNWLGDLIHCEESENRENRPCSEVDDVIRRASQTTNLEERWELYREVENMLFDDSGLAPIIPLYVRSNTILVQGWVEKFVPALFGGEQFDTYQLNADLKELEQSR